MYKLLIEDDEGGQTAVSLIRDEITIGRKEGNTIRLTDRNVSRRHGRIVREDDRIYIEDVAARYGIEKNGQRIDDRAEFGEGDVVVIGDYRLTLKPDKKAKKSPDDAPAAPEKPESASGGFSAGEDTQIMPAMAASLMVISSNFAGEEFELHDNEMVIGRGNDCDIIIDHRSISSRHAKVVREDNVTYKIVDLNSKNGVVVSGDTYSATILKRGDIIELGHVKLRFVEPGENYVFDPDAASSVADAPVPDSGSGSGLDTKLIGVVAVGLIAAIAVGALVMLPAGDDDPDTADDVPREAVADLAQMDQGDERIDQSIDTARDELQQGDLRGASTRLEMLEEHTEPSADQSGRIDRLRDRIRAEQPYQAHYEEAVDALEDDRPLDALAQVGSIPTDSLFYDRLEEQQLLDDVLEAALDAGQEAVDDEQFDTARDIADEMLMADPGFEPAAELLEQINERQQAIAADDSSDDQRLAAADDTGAGSSPAGGRDDSSASPSPDPQPQPDPQPRAQPQPDPTPGMTAEEAREKYTEAARALTSDPTRAISICTEALNAGHTDCHRILGLAHARQGDTDSACRHFRQYMNTGPSNPGAVQSQMDRLECD